jgi:phosphotransferase system enzyme I (PtsI)
MEVLNGISASPGLGEGRSVVFDEPDLTVSNTRADTPEMEDQRLTSAVEESISELVEIKERVRSGVGEDFAHIFRSQQTIVEDESIIGEVREGIQSSGLAAEAAVMKVFEAYIGMFDELGAEDYNKARVADLTDVYKRLLRHLLGVTAPDLARLPDGSVIVAEDLLPSDTAMLDRAVVRAFVTEKGGLTSHVAILAKSLGIPAAVGVAQAREHISDGCAVFVDARSSTGARVYVDADEQTAANLRAERDAYQQHLDELEQEKDLQPTTLDGRELIVSGNLGSDSDIEDAQHHGLKSVGLFRTEFLFLKASSSPSEERQFEAYRHVASELNPGMVVFRTLDVGGDKRIDYMSLPEEQNPFLGMRAIRLSLVDVEPFKAQLRAILRASAYGNVKMMFPMVSAVNEVRRLKEILDDARHDLSVERVEYDPDMEVGIMVEIPSAVLMADALADEVDFMSIGTNDLTQYLLAADRMNENVRAYYEPFHPAVFRAVKQVVEAMHRRDKWVGVCGELGGMAEAVPVLVGLGVDELSMTPQLMPEAIHIIRRLNADEARALAEEVLAQPDAFEVRRVLAKQGAHGQG